VAAIVPLDRRFGEPEYFGPAAAWWRAEIVRAATRFPRSAFWRRGAPGLQSFGA
jgi:hypothetical protein